MQEEGKLAEIRQMLNAVQQWIEIHQKYDAKYNGAWTVNQQTEEDQQKYTDGRVAIEKIRANHYEYLKLLLPIAEAAVALDYVWLQRAQHEMTFTDEDLEPLNHLQKMVEELKKE